MQGSPLAYVWPEEGAVQIPTPYAILKDSDVPELAQASLDYLYSERAQQLYVDLGYVSVLSDIGIPEGIAGEFNPIPVEGVY